MAAPQHAGSAGGAVLRALADASTDALLATDADGVVTDANSAAERLLARPRAGLIGGELAQLVPDGARLQMAHALRDVVVWRVDTRAAPERGHLLEQRLQTVLERFPEGIVAVDRGLRVRFANTRARQLFAPKRIVVDRPLPEPWPEVSLRDAVRELYRSRAPSAERSVELADGRVLRLSASPPNDVEPALLIIVDMTSQVRRERSQRDFVRNAAHQLRTPLASIVSSVEVLKAGAKDDPEARDRFLDHIDRECARLTRLTRALLVLARAQAAAQKPKLEYVPLAPLLQTVAAALRPADGVSVAVTCPEDIVVLVDPDLAEHAVLSVAENAVQHTGEGSVSLSAHDAGDGTVAVEVQDEGPGIAEQHRQRVLEPFFRVVEDGRGFGLGLPIAAAAVEVLGGELELDSAPGVGTRVSIRLPSAQVVRVEGART